MSNEVTYTQKIHQERLNIIQEDIAMLKQATGKHDEILLGLIISSERMNDTIKKIIDNQEGHAHRLKDIEAISFISRHWKFFLFTILTIVTISLVLHTTIKDLLGMVF